MRIEFEELDREPTALGLLTLHRYHAETGEVGYEVRLNGHFLMASHGELGEVAMARAARRRLGADRRDLVALVGGLGAGHTLRATLELPGVVRVVVVEIGAKVVAWNRRYFADVNARALDDPRVEVVIADLRAHLGASGAVYDLILVDVDNGPGWLASASNAELYGASGVQSCRAALRPGGVLAVWSPSRNPELEATLATVFGAVAAIGGREHDPTPARAGEALVEDVVYLAQRRGREHAR